ncbi:MAG: GAF domain-containing protein, partial [Deltaproteobacteria bacterium]|nr:GAF domain-containing protein [Deltaproteobacteria bacterium]
SRTHLKIQIRRGKYFITDLYSRNGTFANGMDLPPGVETEVMEGIPIVIGNTILGFGEDYESCLSEFLMSAGFSLESSKNGEAAGLRRITGIKNDLKFIYNLACELNESKDIKEIGEVLLDNILILFKRIDRCALILLDKATGNIGNIIYRSKKPVDDKKNVYNKELLEHALMMKKPVMVKDSTIREDEYEKVTESLQLMRIGSAMCVPILDGDDVRGVIYIDSHEKPNGFRKNDAALLKDISGRVNLAIENVLLQRSLD